MFFAIEKVCGPVLKTSKIDIKEMNKKNLIILHGGTTPISIKILFPKIVKANR